MTMNWHIDRHATRAAAEVFRPHRPVVRSNGHQYVINASAYGKVELIPLPAGRFLAAAESPPEVLPNVERDRLGRDLLGHLRRNHIHPWKIVLGSDVAEALRHLLQHESTRDLGSELLTRLPYACNLRARGQLVGRARLAVVEHLTSTIKAHRDDDPLPALVGPSGVGKRTVLLTVTKTLGLSAIELPLRRILTHRMLKTPMECFLDTVLAASAHMREFNLVAITDADLTAQLPHVLARHVLLELSRLPNAVMLASTERWVPEEPAGLALVMCPGLTSVEEASELIGQEEPSLTFANPALSMICRAASLRDAGILPGRVLYVARLVRSLTGGAEGSPSRPFSPDEVAPAIRIGQRAWEEHNP